MTHLISPLWDIADKIMSAPMLKRKLQNLQRMRNYQENAHFQNLCGQNLLVDDKFVSLISICMLLVGFIDIQKK
jgi:hypothetical protein